ncbi:MAG: hypothetical protein KF779_11295 [Hyphomonadaceae bacterium]|nr:hypothetical protein [Hyphomonadaceae bacterium]MCA8886885.1 hypothetical protein [Hyphomonadaceae bacterium]
MRARWKYVCYADDGGDEILETFEPEIIHSSYVDSRGIKRESLISAGFATIHGECFGRSTSLGISSRPHADSALLRDRMR